MVEPFDLETTDRLLSTTRAVRRRLDLERAVEPAVILECIRLAQQAPTASNTQGWHWIVVTDAERRAALAGLYREVADAALPHGRKLHANDPQSARVYDSAEWLAENLQRVPVLVVPCIEGRLGEGAGNAGASSLYGSILPAVWSFQLALRSRGLGSTFTTLHLFREAEAAQLLGVPDDVSQVALLPVAYTRGHEFRPAARPPVESIVHWENWAP